jgi:hypothetical protein
LIGRTWPVTLHLGALTILVAFGIGVPLGIVAAMKQNTWVDYLATLLSIFGFVTPHFVWGILFIMTFALYLKWLPTGGWEGAAVLGFAGDGLCVCADCDDRPLHARQRRRGIARGPRAHGARQGSQRALDHVAPRAAQRADPDGHRLWPADPGFDHRLDLHRGDLPHSWDWAATG